MTGEPLFDLAQIGAGLVLVGLVLAITGRRFRVVRGRVAAGRIRGQCADTR